MIFRDNCPFCGTPDVAVATVVYRKDDESDWRAWPQYSCKTCVRIWLGRKDSRAIFGLTTYLTTRLPNDYGIQSHRSR
jgi:hypothetical protein